MSMEKTTSENEVYKNTIITLETKIETIDREIKALTKDLLNQNFGSQPQRRAWYILRRKRRKERNNLIIKLDLLRK